MNTDTKEKAARNSAVGATDEQHISKNVNSIIADDPGGNNIKPSETSAMMGGLEILSMTELYDSSFEPRVPVVDGLLNSGTYIFAGAPKVGKSFFMAQLAYHVAMGIPLWDYPVRQGAVLYLALEDDFARLQQRLAMMFGEESTDKLYLAIKSKTIKDGLAEQMNCFVKEHADARLIIIDTLQRVRETDGDKMSYGTDYDNMTPLKEFSDRTGVTIIVVHHTRKMAADDVCETISGTNGLLGAVDGALILYKKKRTSTEATLDVIGRDQQEQELTLSRNQDTCVWEKVKSETELFVSKPDPVLEKIAEFITEKNPEWEGTSSELIEVIPGLEAIIQTNTLVRRLNINRGKLFRDYGIYYEPLQRKSDRKPFALRLVEEAS
ncbi:MAG: helicase RepA family protein [Lachnospiraceae bacterium]|nr:helicase RepA family protein [Lachnospiraceae bacterium]